MPNQILLYIPVDWHTLHVKYLGGRRFSETHTTRLLLSKVKKTCSNIVMANRQNNIMAIRSSSPSGSLTNHTTADCKATPIEQTAVNLTVVMPRFIPTFPGQVMLTACGNGDSSLSSSDDECHSDNEDISREGRGNSYLSNFSQCSTLSKPSSRHVRDECREKNRRRRNPSHNIRFFTWRSDSKRSERAGRAKTSDSEFRLNPRELFAFSDLDYVIPHEVREVLKEEGVDDATLEAWLKCREVWHRRAEALRFFEMAK